MKKPYQVTIERTQKKLDKKLAQLERLEDKLNEATNPVSQASLKGKITRCKKDIEILRRRI